MIGRAFLAEPGSVKEDAFGRNERQCVKVPVKGREQPRPAEHISIADDLNRDGVAIVFWRFEKHLALLNEVEAVSDFTFSEDALTGVKLGLHRSFAEDFEIFGL